MKIHAGEPGHVLKRTGYGMFHQFRSDPAYTDIDYFNPVAYISSSIRYTTNKAIVTGDNDQTESRTWDGVIEPLTVRAKAFLFEFDKNYFPHDVRGSLSGGNEDQTLSSDRVLSLDYYVSTTTPVAFRDHVEQSSNHPPINGAFNVNHVKIKPFVDERFNRNMSSSIARGSDIEGYMADMTGSTDNYISHKQRSSTCGWVYDNSTTIGTDSIAFGGMTYLMATPKSTRAAPPRRFENYVLTRDTSKSAGIFPIGSSQMLPVPGAAGTSLADDEVSDITPIGFTFNIDGINYKSFVACTNGWMALVDPTVGTFVFGDVISGGSSFTNSKITQPFTNNPVLLCPWFDDLSNLYGKITDVPVTLSTKTRINQGLDISTVLYNPSDFCVKYVNTVSKDGQRCLVVRWHSMSNVLSSTVAVLKFDVVLYENGTIEFRYVPRSSLMGNSDPSYEGATVGIFLNNQPVTGWRFRDFSPGLGYKDAGRVLDPRGGASYTLTYTDTDSDISPATVPYTVNIEATNFWPGTRSTGCIFTFSPPVNVRSVLPRQALRNLDSATTSPTIARIGDRYRQGISSSPFDDRKTINYVTGVISWPSRLPRLYGDSQPGTIARQSIFTDLILTASINKSAAETFLRNEQFTAVSPFVEHQLPEQNYASGTNAYYDVGSNVDQLGGGLSQPLRSKTQIRLTLPVQYPTKMFDVTSSIYYYNRGYKGWFVPRNANSGKDLANPLLPLTLGSYAEDARGFGAIGNTVSSGSIPGAVGPSWQSDTSFGTAQGIGFDVSSQAKYLSKYYAKSVQNNSEYNATSDEQFELPIDRPFIIEKAVFEIPFTMGDGWFQDKTNSGVPLDHAPGLGGYDQTIFDFAGPAITVALFNQVTAGPNTYRDLILTGTIIPTGDNMSSVKVYSTKDTGADYMLSVFAPEGYLSYNATPSAVVSPGKGVSGSWAFTGSVVVPCVAGISNGPIVSSLVFASDYSGNTTATQQEANRQSAIRFLTQPYLPVSSKQGRTLTTYLKDIDTFGRSAKSFDPSGRSIYGKEFVTTQRNSTAAGAYRNPLYVSSTYAQLPTYLTDALTSASFGALLMTAVPLATTFPSPYLVMPGDKLTLAISKMRPFLFCKGTYPVSETALDYFTGAIRHDVTINTGSINVTFYGSMLQGAEESHETLNQQLVTDSIHEYVGAEPIVDQFEVEYNGTYYGNSADDYITGSLLTVTDSILLGKKVFTPGARGKVFSKLSPRTQAAPASTPTTDYEVIANPSKAFRLQPWFERTGGVRVTRATNYNERFYDSMMPDLSQCFAADGSSIAIFDADPSGYLDVTRIKHDTSVGIMFFNNVPTVDVGSYVTNSIKNTNWTWSYPFEPRYATAQRQLAISNALRASKMYNTVSNTVSNIDTIPITNFIPFVYGHLSGVGVDPNTLYSYSSHRWIDVDLRTSGPYITSSMSNDDLTKCMYGYGDSNVVIPQSGSIVGGVWQAAASSRTFGGNNYPDFRDHESNNYGVWRCGPVIRGWKYGVYSGLAAYSTCVFRPGHFGHMRDMLEQSLYTKFYQPTDTDTTKSNVLSPAVQIRFINSDGKITSPENTWSQNLSFEATSSMPYFDGETRNRTDINTKTLNKSILTLGSVQFNNPVILKVRGEWLPNQKQIRLTLLSSKTTTRARYNGLLFHLTCRLG